MALKKLSSKRGGCYGRRQWQREKTSEGEENDPPDTNQREKEKLARPVLPLLRGNNVHLHVVSLRDPPSLVPFPHHMRVCVCTRARARLTNAGSVLLHVLAVSSSLPRSPDTIVLRAECGGFPRQ